MTFRIVAGLSVSQTASNRARRHRLTRLDIHPHEIGQIAGCAALGLPRFFIVSTLCLTVLTTILGMLSSRSMEVYCHLLNQQFRTVCGRVNQSLIIVDLRALQLV